MYYIYMLRCKDNSIYTGITTDIARRMKEHFNKEKRCAKYTLTHSAKKLEALWVAENKSLASKLEFNIKKLKKQLQLLLEEDEPKIYQFQQMTHYMTKQYCNYKFHQKMKNGIENIKTLILMDLSAIIVIFGICDEITKWQESVVMCVGALLAVFIPGIGYAIVYHKYKRLKNIESSGCLLEYTNVVLDVGKETKFLCSDGHMEEWKMRSDDDAKVKDGEEAVVIYSPSTHEMFTERKEVMNKICGI